MPIDKHFSGHGREVAAKMKRRYGKDYKRIFYATEQAQKKRKSKRSRNKAALEAMRRGR